MNCYLEIFIVSFDKNYDIRYSKIVIDITSDIRNPDDIVNEIITTWSQVKKCFECDKYISHSTSWRYEEDGSIYLTYIVFSDKINFAGVLSNTLQIQGIEIPQPTSAKKPKPKEISEKHIVSHGIRHIAYLVKHPKCELYRNSLDNETIVLLKKIEVTLAGKL
ncbi:MAG: hypothetical protein OHK0040_02300 [bacterium]